MSSSATPAAASSSEALADAPAALAVNEKATAAARNGDPNAGRRRWWSAITARTRSDVLVISLFVAAFAVIVAVAAWIRTTATPNGADQQFASAFSTSRAKAHILAMTRTEHPQGSNANWAVRAYFLDELNRIAKDHPGCCDVIEHRGPVTAVDPRTVNRTVAFEASNLYFRIKGSNERSGGSRESLLLSAHFDSVASGRGVGDNALGAGTMLEARALIRFRSKSDYKTTVMFNFNNGEEVGYLGALALTKHPLWDDVAAFINVDSVCPTGRPILYRSTSRELVKLFQHTAPYPHASGVGQELMNAGLLQSDTDYTIYRLNNKTGADFAFYDSRWVYHTEGDAETLMQDSSIQQLGVNLLSLVDSVQSAGIDMVRRPPVRSHVIYNDFLGRSMWTIPYVGFAVLCLATAVIVLPSAAWALTAGVSTMTPSWRRYTRGCLAGVKAFGLAISFFLLAFIGSFAIPLAALAIQPMAVSGSFELVLALSLFSGWTVVVAVLAIVRRWKPVSPRLVRSSIILFWVFMLIVIGAMAFMKMSFMSHLYWYSLYPIMMILADLVVPAVAARWGVRVPSALAKTNERDSRADQTASSELPLHSEESVAAAAAASSRDDADVTRGAALYGLATLLLGNVFPLMVTFDFGVEYLSLMAFTVQEATSPLILAAFVAIIVFPIVINTLLMISSLSRRVMNFIAIGLFAVTLILFLVAALVFPFSVARPLKLEIGVESTANGLLEGSDFTLAIQSNDAVFVSMAAVQGASAVKLWGPLRAPGSAFFPIDMPCSVDEGLRLCTVPAKQFENVPDNFAATLSANVTVRGVGELVEVAVSAPGAAAFMCQVPITPDAPLPVLSVTVPTGESTNTTFPGTVRYVAADPTAASTTVRLLVPRDQILARAETVVRCTVYRPQLDGVPETVYRSLLKVKPDWVVFTNTVPYAIGYTKYALTLKNSQPVRGKSLRDHEAAVRGGNPFAALLDRVLFGLV
ncbi:hypothetical protein AMAG_08220 [Allomyces macrogynus ATCC 38327]|uniref:Peptide hydrolase n=1 Tax=Allomyces macrogynus (strain ATCC 38327) TaxID=578462 RepID=A0A0L0SKZ9_ALLM3|nr:hypothetical protein AMAG_08220 [Allomyces macrogynus ATCC 38327]|eukprot:KNE63054.1 hypothetical protein AMAG_08220 [Allomyces macrogynus ATCC 38327]